MINTVISLHLYDCESNKLTFSLNQSYGMVYNQFCLGISNIRSFFSFSSIVDIDDIVNLFPAIEHTNIH